MQTPSFASFRFSFSFRKEIQISPGILSRIKAFRGSTKRAPTFFDDARTNAIRHVAWNRNRRAKKERAEEGRKERESSTRRRTPFSPYRVLEGKTSPSDRILGHSSIGSSPATLESSLIVGPSSLPLFPSPYSHGPVGRHAWHEYLLKTLRPFLIEKLGHVSDMCATHLALAWHLERVSATQTQRSLSFDVRPLTFLRPLLRFDEYFSQLHFLTSIYFPNHESDFFVPACKVVRNSGRVIIATLFDEVGKKTKKRWKKRSTNRIVGGS